MIKFGSMYAEDIENLREAYLSKVEKEYIQVMSNDPEMLVKINEFYKNFEKLSEEDIIKVIINKINTIECGEYVDEKELEKKKLEIALILNNISFGSNESKKYWEQIKLKIPEKQGDKNIF